MSNALFLAAIKKDPGPIPELEPPRGKLAFDLPERTILAAVLCLGIAALMIGRLLHRRQPLPIPPPALPIAIAREELESLGLHGSPAAVYAETARIVRHYIHAIFQLGSDASTTSELVDRLSLHSQLNSDDLHRIRRLLYDCDLVQFAPAQEPSAPHEMVTRALDLLTHLDGLRRPGPPASTVAVSSPPQPNPVEPENA